MAAPLLYKALNKYAELFQKKEKHPIEWDPKIQKIIYISDKKSLRIWHLCQTVVIFGILCILLIAFRQLFSKQRLFPMWIVIGLIVICLLGIAALFENIAMFVYGRDTIDSWNNLMSLKPLNYNSKFFPIL